MKRQIPDNPISVDLYLDYIAEFSVRERKRVRESVGLIVDRLLDVREKGGRVFVAGNGGASATASHFVADLRKFTGCGLKATCLSDNTPYLTAVGNDVSYDDVFADALQVEGESADCLVALSTSGNSKNILKAVEVAHQKKMYVIAMTGNVIGLLARRVTGRGIVAYVYHPDIRGQEDMIGIFCHLVAGELRRELKKEKHEGSLSR
jgi:D-sedoheptulose 7-phosphate isomerase